MSIVDGEIYKDDIGERKFLYSIAIRVCVYYYFINLRIRIIQYYTVTRYGTMFQQVDRQQNICGLVTFCFKVYFEIWIVCSHFYPRRSLWLG